MQVRWSARKNSEGFLDCYCSVDATDCPIQEPTPFSSIWYSHKLNASALRYEVAVTLRNPEVCWVNGPWPAGQFSDLRIFRQDLKQNLDENEYVIADGTYADEKCFQPPGRFHPAHKPLSLIRARHENLNSRLKVFNVLSTKFRHGLNRHRSCFMAVVNVTCLSLQIEPLCHLELDPDTELE